jgi:hypothetical protein
MMICWLQNSEEIGFEEQYIDNNLIKTNDRGKYFDEYEESFRNNTIMKVFESEKLIVYEEEMVQDELETWLGIAAIKRNINNRWETY